MKFQYLAIIPVFLLGACSVINTEPNKRIDSVNESLKSVEEKVDALLAYNNKTYDILVDNELRLAELEKDAKKRGVSVPQKSADITSLKSSGYISPNLAKDVTQNQSNSQVEHDGVLKTQNAQEVKTEVGAITGQDLSKQATQQNVQEQTQMAVKENVVEPPKRVEQPKTIPAKQAKETRVKETSETTTQNTSVSQPIAKLPVKQEQKTVASVTTEKTQEVKALPNTAQTSTQAYNNAFSLYQNHEYAKAEKAFDEFLAKFPNDVLAPNALYWKGETLYARAIYPQAIFAFKEVQTRYPKHPKTPDSLLKTAMCYARLGDTENASLHYLVLVEDWPNSNAAKKARSMGAVQ